MSIQDYRILTGVFNAYIVVPAKKGSSYDWTAKVITEGEITNLIAWWLDKKLGGTKNKRQIIVKDGEEIIELKRLKNYDI